MSKIKVLDELTVQKIAAGEVIERPSSIVKELVENSLDANSSSITVEIRNGGKSYIRVTDDGDGFLEEDLQIAFKRHSTSKINTVDDLYRIMSFGFRGEALASISAVSKVEVLTKTEGSLSGIQAFVEEGKIVRQQPVGCPKGTTMIVRDLFYNLPVRKGFLKSDTVESNHISDILYKLALGNEGITFKFIKDNKIIFNTTKNNDLITNVYTLLGKEFSDNLIKVDYERENLRIYGYISNNTFYRSNRNHQYIYVNNRYIKDDFISNIIESRYKSVIPNNRFPVFLIFIEVDPSFIDVNIHPTKQQIKFSNQLNIQEVLEDIVDKTIYEAMSIPKALLAEGKIDDKIEELPLLYKVDGGNGEWKAYDSPYDSSMESENNVLEENVEYLDKDKGNTIETGISGEKRNGFNDIFERGRIVGVVFSTYILVENLELNKLYIIDQHAAHERIMYERYKREYEDERVVTQKLITPEIIELTNGEFATVMENMELFRKLGFELEEFGTNSVIIRGVPIIFGKPEIKKLFFELLDTIGSNIRSSYEVKLDKIMKIACTKAIKSGDSITNLEIKSLFDQLKNTKNPFTCPHGRPTIIEISREDLEKEFKRIV
ncbi:MAG: DNA mismatch repair endonuclease MutL [Tissierellia bacterium]|nr:DNA mismatch repair endonuclease MutL [Tissierellia bacterium]